MKHSSLCFLRSKLRWEADIHEPIALCSTFFYFSLDARKQQKRLFLGNDKNTTLYKDLQESSHSLAVSGAYSMMLANDLLVSFLWFAMHPLSRWYILIIITAVHLHFMIYLPTLYRSSRWICVFTYIYLYLPIFIMCQKVKLVTCTKGLHDCANTEVNARREKCQRRKGTGRKTFLHLQKRILENNLEKYNFHLENSTLMSCIGVTEVDNSVIILQIILLVNVVTLEVS